MKVPIELLVVLVVAVGVAPAYTVGPILDVVATSVLQRGLPEFSLSPWHGFNLAFMMSLVALIGGVVVYAFRHRIFALHDRFFPPVSGRNVTEGLLHRIFALTIRVNALVENGSLQRYLFLLIASALAVGFVAFRDVPLFGTVPAQALDIQTLAYGAFLVVAAIGTVVFHRARFIAVVVIGVVGLMVSLLFVRFSGPDIAMTQLRWHCSFCHGGHPSNPDLPDACGTRQWRCWQARESPCSAMPRSRDLSTASPISSWRKPSPVEAAPISSTSSWSTFAASIRSARSPCWVSRPSAST
jgi:hypothetical protein